MKPNTRDLNVIRWSHPSGEVQSYRLCENVSYQWKTLGQILGFSEGFLKGVAISNRDRPGDCWSDVVGRWLEEGSEPVAAYPSSWQGLIAALEDGGGCRLEITRLCKALENRVRYIHNYTGTCTCTYVHRINLFTRLRMYMYMYVS